MISALDNAMGSILDVVDQTDQAVNTMIVLISDNGGVSYTSATENGPLKGGKLTQFEGGISVPFMLRWHDEIPACSRVAEPVSSTDVFQTVAAAVGAELPEDRDYDGVDLLPPATGQATSAPHETLFQKADHTWAIRDGDYKLILRARDGWAELYHLDKDIPESFNLQDDMPDLYEQLHLKHLDWQGNLPGKPLWPRVMDYKFILDGKEYLFPA